MPRKGRDLWDFKCDCPGIDHYATGPLTRTFCDWWWPLEQPAPVPRTFPRPLPKPSPPKPPCDDVNGDGDDGPDNECDFYYGWCKWATDPVNRKIRGEIWNRWGGNLADCMECKKVCLSTGTWPHKRCPPNGKPGGPRWGDGVNPPKTGE